MSSGLKRFQNELPKGVQLRKVGGTVPRPLIAKNAIHGAQR